MDNQQEDQKQPDEIDQPDKYTPLDTNQPTQEFSTTTEPQNTQAITQQPENFNYSNPLASPTYPLNNNQSPIPVPTPQTSNTNLSTDTSSALTNLPISRTPKAKSIRNISFVLLLVSIVLFGIGFYFSYKNGWATYYYSTIGLLGIALSLILSIIYFIIDRKNKDKFYKVFLAIVIVIAAITVGTSSLAYIQLRKNNSAQAPSTSVPTPIKYVNPDYGFQFKLPEDWKNFVVQKHKPSGTWKDSINYYTFSKPNSTDTFTIAVYDQSKCCSLDIESGLIKQDNGETGYKGPYYDYIYFSNKSDDTVIQTFKSKQDIQNPDRQ